MLAAGLVSGLAGAVAAAGRAVAAATAGDVQLLSSLVASEALATYCYATILHNGTIAASNKPTLAELHRHEQQHVAALAPLLAQLGGTAAPPIANVAAADAMLSAAKVTGSLASLDSQTDSLKLLYNVEAMLEGAYWKAIAQLQAFDLIRLAAEILAVEGQHATVIAEVLRPGDVERAVPWPFVQGA